MKRIIKALLLTAIIVVGCIIGKDVYNKKLKEARLLRKSEKESKKDSNVYTNKMHTRRYIRIK